MTDRNDNDELTPEMRAAASALGKRGAKKFREMLGEEGYHEFHRQMGLKGGTANRERHDREYFSALGRMGGNANKAKNGIEHYREMGRKGGAKVRAAFEALRAQEAAEKTKETL